MPLTRVVPYIEGCPYETGLMNIKDIAALAVTLVWPCVTMMLDVHRQ